MGDMQKPHRDPGNQILGRRGARHPVRLSRTLPAQQPPGLAGQVKPLAGAGVGAMSAVLCSSLPRGVLLTSLVMVSLLMKSAKATVGVQGSFWL